MIVLYIILWIWQLPQNLLGFLLYHKLGKSGHIGPVGFKYTYTEKIYLPCLCLGEYLFVKDTRLLRFSLGRGFLSLIFGPFYIPLIQLPSLIFMFLNNPSAYMGLYSTRWSIALGRKS